jgi:hypothetical protein
MIKRVCLFKPIDEFINLAWPAVLLFLIIFSIYFHSKHFSNDSVKTLLFISGVLFFNVTHNIFSIFIVILSPDIRKAFVAIYQSSKVDFLFRWLGIFTCIFIFFLVYKRIVPAEYAGIKFHLILSILLQIIAFYYHTIKQIEGLSVAYNMKSKNSYFFTDNENLKLNYHGKVEKKLFFLFLMVCILGLICRLNQYQDPTNLIFYIAMFIFTAIIFNSFLFPHSTKSNKLIFQSRLLFFVLGIIEYLFVFRKVVSISEEKFNAIKRTFVFIMILTTAVVGLLSITRFDRGFGTELTEVFPGMFSLFLVLSVLSNSITYMHFYLDSLIFKMKDTHIRNSVGTIITS